jgi:prepilin-type N-terminal cleavage/methylation domain-containing protein
MKTPKQPQPPTPSAQSGFTLIECLLAIIIVSVLMIAIAPAIALSVATRVQARRVEVATQAARTYVDGLRAQTIPPPPNVIYLKNQSSTNNGTDKNLFTDTPGPIGAADWNCTPGYTSKLVEPTLGNAGEFYCKDGGNLWSLYCVDKDGDGSCKSSSAQDLIVQSFRTITLPPPPATPNYTALPVDPAEAKKGYILGIRVYRADGLKGSGALRTSVDAQGRSRRQLAATGGAGDRRAPLVELTTEIRGDQTNWKSLCERLGGCTAPP